MDESKIIGLFDNEADMDAAASDLQLQDIEFEIVQQQQMEGTVDDLAGAAAIANPVAMVDAAIAPVVHAFDAGGVNSLDYLVDKGVPKAEAPIYADGLRHGGHLMIVSAGDEKETGIAKEILQQHQASRIFAWA